MRKSGETGLSIGRDLSQSSVLAPLVFGARVADFLRTLHPAKTATCVEADTNISAKTVAKWLEGASSPSGAAYHRLIKAYPDLPVFVSPDTAPEVLREAARIVAQARLEAQVAKFRRQFSAAMGDL